MNWLIKFLGGHTKDEMERLSLVSDSWRTRATAAETTVALFKEIMTRERDRADKLLDERLAGESRRFDEPHAPPSMKPVGNSVSSWPRIKRELEKEHRVNDQGKSHAEVSREEIEKTIRLRE